MNTRVKIDKTSSEEEAVIEMKEEILSCLDHADDLSDIISLGFSMIKMGLSSYVFSELMTKDDANKVIDETSNSLKLSIETVEIISEIHKLKEKLGQA